MFVELEAHHLPVGEFGLKKVQRCGVRPGGLQTGPVRVSGHADGQGAIENEHIAPFHAHAIGDEADLF